MGAVNPFAIARRLIVITALLLAARSANAQTLAGENPNVIGIELLGRAGLYSVNYERFITPRVGFGVGFARDTLIGGFFSYTRSDSTLVPIYVSWTPIGDRHSIYVGAGTTVSTVKQTDLISHAPSRSWGSIGTATFGYQYRSSRGLLVRPTVSRLFTSTSGTFWPGITLGVTF